MTSADAQTEAGLPGPARASQEPLAASIRLAGAHPRPSARLRLAALLVALAAHAAVLYAFTHQPPDLRAGGHGHLPAAVNVTMVNSAVFESRQDVRAPPTPAPADAVEANEGTPKTKHGPQRPEQKEEKAEEKKKAPDEPVPAEAIVKTPPKASEPQQEQVKESKETSTPADTKGGVTARGDAPSSAKQSAPAAASPGAVREYADAVAQALARTKPRRVPAYGTVEVKLIVSPDGGFSSIEILKSSGNGRLDDAVLAAVRRAKLPTPPPALAPKERWFEFTYRFER